jgi:hypothetical protein
VVRSSEATIRRALKSHAGWLTARLRSAASRRGWLALAALLAPACNSALSQAFELTCAYVRADQEAAWSDPLQLQVLTARPFNASVAVAYGSPACSGFVLDIHNPNAWSPRTLSIDAGATNDVAGDGALFGAPDRCAARTLSVDVWGWANKVWTPLVSKTAAGGKLEPLAAQDAGAACTLGIGFGARTDDARDATGSALYASKALGAYQTYRVVGRVSNGSSARFPFRVELR